jgi:hypothetical protein
MICLATWHVQRLFRVNVGKELVNGLRQYKPLIKRYDITKLKQVCPSRTERKKKHYTGETSTYKYSRRRMEEY